MTRAAPGGARAGSGSSGSTRSSLIATHPVELCRYPNKRCWSARVLKDNGELHSFCEWHRSCANQYQRRLEARRRDKKLGGGDTASSAVASPATTPVAASAAAPPPEHKPNMCVKGIQSLAEATSRAIAGTTPTAEKPPTAESKARTLRALAKQPAVAATATGADEYEPFQSPVPLQIEDLQYLSLCFPEATGGDTSHLRPTE